MTICFPLAASTTDSNSANADGCFSCGSTALDHQANPESDGRRTEPGTETEQGMPGGCACTRTYHPVVVLGAARRGGHRHGVQPGSRGRPAPDPLRRRRRERLEAAPGLRLHRRRRGGGQRVLGGECGLLRHLRSSGWTGAKRRRASRGIKGKQRSAQRGAGAGRGRRRLGVLGVLFIDNPPGLVRWLCSGSMLGPIELLLVASNLVDKAGGTHHAIACVARYNI
jgi:hypothetical protein